MQYVFRVLVSVCDVYVIIYYMYVCYIGVCATCYMYLLIFFYLWYTHNSVS